MVFDLGIRDVCDVCDVCDVATHWPCDHWSVPGPVVYRTPTDGDESLSRLGAAARQVGLDSGLAAVGIASADIFTETREVLHARRRDGLHGTMEFTYRNPDRSTDPGRILEGARSLVVGAWGYRRADPISSQVTISVRGDSTPTDTTSGHAHPTGLAPHPPKGTVARYARHDYYRSLRRALERIADRLRADGWRAIVVVDDNALVDRAAAQRAGLGWFGKNSLLLLPALGSWYVLGSVVTDAPLEPSAPSGPSEPAEGCGSCRRCITACPTGAIVADGVIDARRCLAWLVQAPGAIPVEFRTAMGSRIYGCDECQDACPINRVTDRRHRSPASEPGSVATIDLLDLLAATDDELIDAHGRWYIAKRDPRYLRRNALVALGNVGDRRDPETSAALDRWASGDDELLAEHARWARDQLGRLDGASPLGAGAGAEAGTGAGAGAGPGAGATR